MSFYSDVICRDPRFSSPLPCRDTALLFPPFRVALEALISDAAIAGVKLIVTETFRSAALQQHDEEVGASQLKVGVHHFGLAADVAIERDGSVDWAARDYLFLQALAQKHSLIWGGDWGDPAKLNETGVFHDWDHLQFCTVEQQDALFAGTWYPPDTAAA